jgi:hypothetical protein
MPDLPAILEGVRQEPDDARRWLALAAWYATSGREDEATALRMFWPVVRENVVVGRMGLETALAGVAENAAVLADVARQIEARRVAEDG